MEKYSNVLSSGRAQAIHDDYPVHLIEWIQPYGVLVVLTWPELVIERVSRNSQQHLELSSGQLLGRSLEYLLGKPGAQQLKTAALKLTTTPHSEQPHRPAYLQLNVGEAAQAKQFDGLLHYVQGRFVLELEPRSRAIAHSTSHTDQADEPANTDETANTIERSQNHLSQTISTLRAIRDINKFLAAAAVEIRRMTAYDRVMVYQFDDKAAGEVIAEAKNPNQDAYLGLHYPATDIPALVRSFYLAGMTRFIPDLSAEPVGIDGPSAPLLNLSAVALRGVDPCCVEYHLNMNVAAFLVISIVKDGQLWGLISCHHNTPKYLPYQTRVSCEILSQFIAAELSNKVNEEEIAYLNQLKAIQADFITSIAAAEDFKEALIHPEPRLLDLVTATGAAVCLDQDITLIGKTPELEAVRTLIDWSLQETEDDIFYTDRLPTQHSASAAYATVASGVLILTISKLRRYLIVWFRPEILQTVSWAGDPSDSIQITEDNTVLLCPRSSFGLWKETVRGTSLPWKPAEIESAAQLKSTIVGIVLNKADELAQINLDLSRSNRELDSFAYAASHDLKEPLRGITNFANILLRRHSEALDEKGVMRIETLVRLAQRMDTLIDALLRFSRLGQADLSRQPTDMNALVHTVIDDLMIGRDALATASVVKVVRPLPTVVCDPTLMREVFTNLIGNALKYSDRSEPSIEVGYLTRDESVVFYVKDNGIGISERHFQNIFRLFKRLHDRESYGGGNGVGLTITQKIIERHQGHIWVESTVGEGTVFYFDI